MPRNSSGAQPCLSMKPAMDATCNDVGCSLLLLKKDWRLKEARGTV